MNIGMYTMAEGLDSGNSTFHTKQGLHKGRIYISQGFLLTC